MNFDHWWYGKDVTVHESKIRDGAEGRFPSLKRLCAIPLGKEISRIVHSLAIYLPTVGLPVWWTEYREKLLRQVVILGTLGERDRGISW